MVGSISANSIKSEAFEMEWPPNSGQIASFPEVDSAEWFTLAIARDKIVKGQRIFLDRLEEILRTGA